MDIQSLLLKHFATELDIQSFNIPILNEILVTVREKKIEDFIYKVKNMNREYLKEKDKYNFSIVHYSTRLNSEKVISTLYELNNDCFKDEQELSVLFEACIFGSTNVVNELINNDKYRVNINFIKISNNWTPLLVSVYGGRLDIVEKLLEKNKK